jgi:hypothetical protein
VVQLHQQTAVEQIHRDDHGAQAALYQRAERELLVPPVNPARKGATENEDDDMQTNGWTM